jgi:hypothetical protein
MDMDIHRADGGKGIQDKTNTTTFVFSTCPFRQVKKQMKKRIHFHFRVLSSKWFVVVIVVVGRAKYEPIRYTQRERKRERLYKKPITRPTAPKERVIIPFHYIFLI